MKGRSGEARARRPVLKAFVVLLAALVLGQGFLVSLTHRAYHRLQEHMDSVVRGLEEVHAWQRAVDEWAMEMLPSLEEISYGGSLQDAPAWPQRLQAVGAAAESPPALPEVQDTLRRLRAGVETLRAQAARLAAASEAASLERRLARADALWRTLQDVRASLGALDGAYREALHSATVQAEALYHRLLWGQMVLLALVLGVGGGMAWRAARAVEAIERRYEEELDLRKRIEDELDGHRDRLEELVDERTMELSYQASHDALTGLLNRYEFERRLEITLSLCRTANCTSSILYLDLDRFKIINDTCGHLAGDELLRQIAALLQQHLRKGDTLARLGGDEFAVILDGCDPDQASRIAETLREAIIRYRFFWHGGVYSVGVSIGIAPLTPDELSLSEALNRADAACCLAKQEGRNRVRIYAERDEDVEQQRKDMVWIHRVRTALEEDHLELFGQPIAPARKGSAAPLHCEVLLRLRDPNTGALFSPGDFVPAAERYGFMGDLDRWVLDQAMASYTAYFDPEWIGERPILFVNISAQTLADVEFGRWVRDRLHEYGFPEGQLCLEITETAAIANLSRAKALMAELQEQGVVFALDDFGSGLTSFSYLRSLPLQYLKIEGEFVRDMQRDEIAVALVRAINDIGHVLGLRTITEYVENPTLLRQVRKLGVDYCQGYLLARPARLERAFALCVEMPRKARVAT